MGMIRTGAVAAALVTGLSATTGAYATDIHWYGQAAIRITTDAGKVIVVDPFIMKNPKTPEDQKDLAKVGSVDLILVTHGHGDHWGDTAELAAMTGAKVGMNADMGSTIQNLGLVPKEQLIRFNKSGPITPVEGVTVTMVRAEHSSSVSAPGQDGKPFAYPGGEPSGYIIQIDGGPTIYHAGDTGVFGDMGWIGSYYEPDVAFLPIGGWFTMDPSHAAFATRELIKPKTVMPIHYATFPPLKGTPEEFKAALGDYSGEVVVMQPGETRKF